MASLGSITEKMAGVIGTSAHMSFVETVKFDHIIFKLQVYKAMLGFIELAPEDLVDHHQCRLGKWYFAGRGHQECQGHPAFARIDAPHADVHRLAREALTAFQSAEYEKARDLLARLETASDAVTDALEALEAQPCGAAR
ncbi:CZB domain-containing protein [Paludibacterium paludis]